MGGIIKNLKYGIFDCSHEPNYFDYKEWYVLLRDEYQCPQCKSFFALLGNVGSCDGHAGEKELYPKEGL